MLRCLKAQLCFLHLGLVLKTQLLPQCTVRGRRRVRQVCWPAPDVHHGAAGRAVRVAAVNVNVSVNFNVNVQAVTNLAPVNVNLNADVHVSVIKLYM